MSENPFDKDLPLQEQLEKPFQEITITKKTRNYVMDETLRDLQQAGIIEYYDIKRSAEGSEVTMKFFLREE